MNTNLKEIDKFVSDDAFNRAKSQIEELVLAGVLKACGLDPNETSRFVEIYRREDGETWHLAIPDHAFRGYLKKTSM